MIVVLGLLLRYSRRAANEIGLDCNIANLVRWRVHGHLSQQSVGWFQDDLTGRTSARMVDIGNHAANIIYQSLNAIVFGLVYMVGIVTLMAGADLQLALPLLSWLVLYITVIVVVIPRMVEAQCQFQVARSGMVGRVVDNFSNFDVVKLFARSEFIADEHEALLEKTRQKLFRTRQLDVGLRTTVVALEGVMVVGLVGHGTWLWSAGAAPLV